MIEEDGIPEDEAIRTACGKCRNFGSKLEFNFGPCSIDAYGDGLPLHKMYKSACPKWARKVKRPSKKDVAQCGKYVLTFEGSLI